MTEQNRNLEELQKSAIGNISQSMISTMQWDSPIPFSEDTQEHFDLELLPKAVGDYCRELADSLHVSGDMVGTCALGILSSACQSHTVIINEGTGWTEPLNLYVAVVAEPGERKSPVLNALKKPLIDWQTSHNRDLQSDIAKSKAEYELLKSRLLRAKSEASKNDDPALDDTVYELAAQFENFTPVKAVQLISDDITSEALAVKMKDNGEKLSVISSEGGILQTICGRYTQGIANADIYLKSFFGESAQIDRINRESDTLTRPILSMLLCVQPVVLETLTSNKELRHNGLADRFLFSVPPSSLGKARFKTEPISQKTEVAYRNTIMRLLDGRDNPLYLRLSDEAERLFAGFYDAFQAFRITGELSDIAGWASKHPGIVARIAGLLQLADDGSEIISEKNMIAAICLSDFFTSQVKTALGEVRDSVTVKKAEYVLGRIKAMNKPEISIRELQRSLSKTQIKNRDELASPLQELINRGYIAIDEAADISKVQLLHINPMILDERRANEQH